MLKQLRGPLRPVLLAGAAMFALLVALALISEFVFHQSTDPTEQSFAVTLHNDTSRAVVLKQCDARCSSFHEQDRLSPGANVGVNTSGDNVANWWLVADESSGRTLGCLDLRHSRKIERLVVNVSSRAACPAS